MDIENLCKHVKQVLGKCGYAYCVYWESVEEVLIWKQGTNELVFSKNDAAHFEAERTTHNRYLGYIIAHLPKIELVTTAIHRILSTLTHQQQAIVPLELSYRFPKMIAYSTSKKKISLNPIKLAAYVEKTKENTTLSSEEIITFIFLHEYGHYLEDKKCGVTTCVANAKKECQEEGFLLTRVQSFLYETEKNAWANGKHFLPLFSYDEYAYECFSLIPLASYDQPSMAYLREKWYYVLQSP